MGQRLCAKSKNFNFVFLVVLELSFDLSFKNVRFSLSEALCATETLFLVLTHYVNFKRL